MDFRQFNDHHWRQTIPETYAAFAKAAAVLEAAPMPKPKRMPRLLREIAETVLDIPLDLGNWLQGFLRWEVPDGLYTTIAPNFFAIVHDLTSRYPKSDEVALVGKLIFAFEEFARTGKPRPGLAPDEDADLRFCYRTIIAGFTAKLHPAYWNLTRWIFLSPFRFHAALRIVRRHRHLRLNAPPRPLLSYASVLALSVGHAVPKPAPEATQFKRDSQPPPAASFSHGQQRRPVDIANAV